MNKKRVLFVNEASYLATGFSTYGNEVLSRLFQSGEYELAEFGCVPDPYSMIQMADGSLKPISLIKIGDKVITHTGESREVTRTFQKWYSGKIIKISREFFGGKTLKTTPNHPILAIKKCNAYIKYPSGGKHFNRSAHYEWIKAEDLQKGDFVAYTPAKSFGNYKNKIKRYGLEIELNDDLAFLGGWFLAEGYIGFDKKFGNNHFGVCANYPKEEFHIKRFCECVKNIFNIDANYVANPDKGVFECKISNRYATKIIQSLFGNGCYDKFIDTLLWSDNYDFLIKLIAHYIEGDGCSSKSRNDICVKTSSKQLSLDIMRILLSAKIRCSLQLNTNNKKNYYSIRIAGQHASKIAKYFIYKNNQFKPLKREETLKINGIIFSKITQINKYDHNGLVYNLEVSTNDSYICNNYVIHNSYSRDDDPRIRNIPWKFYPNQPGGNDREGLRQYHSNKTNQFGEWRFSQVCLDFKPDVVIAIRDWWMDEFLIRSPLRNKYKLIWMPTIDGIPQRDEWLDSYKLCDRILTYSRWGYKVLEKDGRKNTELVCTAAPGVDIDVFKPPENPKEHKRKFGIPPEAIIIGMVARNQKRKLFYDLIEAFSQWIYKNKSKGHLELVNKTFLYLHTSFPDQGWDIGKAIKEFNVSNKVLMTYLCKNCHTVFPSFFSGEISYCKKCNKLAAQPPNANTHVPRHILADIMKIFDLCVQYTICEGAGMPPIEAMSCGVPVMATRYSAMEDYVDAPHSMPIEVERFFREPMTETEQRRALPSNKDFVQKLDKFLKINQNRRLEMSQEIRNYIVEPISTYGTDKKFPRYSWDRTAEIWRNVIRDIDIHDRSLTWDNNKPILKDPNKTPPDNLNNADFVRWLITQFWQRNEMAYTTFAANWIKALNCGYTQDGMRTIQMNRQLAYQHFQKMIEHENQLEIHRTSRRKTHNENELNLVAI